MERDSFECLIGLTGQAGSGKDEAARVLVEEFGFKRYAFATELRREVADALAEGLPSDVPEEAMALAVTHIGDPQAAYRKPYPDTMRRLLQLWGYEYRRKMYGEDYWVRQLASAAVEPRVVISDVRFPNEYNWVKTRDGGEIWRILRPGLQQMSHVSETALRGYPVDCQIHNNRGLEDFRKQVRAAALLTNVTPQCSQRQDSRVCNQESI